MSSESLSDVKQNDWIRACRKLGLQVETNRGKGGHVLVKHPQNGMKYTVQSDLHKIINIKIFHKLEQWGFTEEQIFEALR
ncbi:hypothetical protein KBC54_03535 [Patescibacteria group bacterium]|nr:hypothetical protein [Patescibacteria group bacterium]